MRIARGYRWILAKTPAYGELSPDGFDIVLLLHQFEIPGAVGHIADQYSAYDALVANHQAFVNAGMAVQINLFLVAGLGLMPPHGVYIQAADFEFDGVLNIAITHRLTG